MRTMTEDSTSLQEGAVVAGRFRLDRPLGQGAMGSVWAAWHITLNVPVAVKFINAELASRPELRSRFAQEAQAAAMLDSPHVVRVLDHGTDEAGRPYIAMAMLRGESLADRLKRERVLALALVARVVTHTAKGLAKAHRHGVFHRDIKPENLFLAEDEDEGVIVKILDFGIAKSLTFAGGHQTAKGLVIGTPHYLSPEQAMGTQVDHRCDLFALGVVAYRCLSGSVPFDSDSMAGLILTITSEPHTPMSTLRPDLGSALDPWFAASLAKDPAHRYQDAKSMARAFVDICNALDPNAAAVPNSAITVGPWHETTGVRGNDPLEASPDARLPSRSLAQPVASPGVPTAQPALSTGVGTARAQPAAQHPSESLPGVQVADVPSSIDEPPVLPMRRSIVPMILIGLLALGGVGAGALWWLHTRDASSSTASTASGNQAGPSSNHATTALSAPAAAPTLSSSASHEIDLDAARPDARSPDATSPNSTRADSTSHPRPTPTATATAPRSKPHTAGDKPPAPSPPTDSKRRRGCRSNADCKGERICVQGECRNR